MKKYVKVSLSAFLALVLMLGMALTVSASMSKIVELTGVTDKNGKQLEYRTEEVPAEIRLTEIIAAPKIEGKEEGDIEVIWQQDVLVDSTPATLAFTCNGTDGKTIYAFHYDAEKKDWELIDSAKGPKVEFTFDKLSPVGLVVEKETTPATGDRNYNQMLLWGGLMVAAAAGIAGLVAYEKKHQA
ncbi:MAG: hypothetical protein IKI54_02155 [Lachnospiraceae bacterium]|nr:hypothetical protein [Lachnospiraceae bacterium]